MSESEPMPGDLFDLSGRVAIVTGGAQGIGRAYCLALASAGAAVVVADLEDGGAVAERITASGGSAIAVTVDITSEADTRRMAERANEEFGRIDVLINNAGYFRFVERAHFTEITETEWAKAFDVNVRGTWLCCKSVYPYMQTQSSGRIINVSSMTAIKGKEGFLHYVTSKAAIIGFTRTLAREVGPDNISVNTVVPEYIPHDLPSASDMPWIDEKVVNDRVFKRTQVPEDMVGVVVFLSSGASEFITGQSFLVNGGTWFQ